jgi:hypothetical protein
MNILPCKWVFVKKENPDGSDLCKARLVVGGHRQTYGIDYHETFAPVVKYQSIRIILAIATARGWFVHQMDFVTAFLNSDLEEKIYMVQPTGYENGKDEVCELVKGIYGLKQAPRAWNNEYHLTMIKLGFRLITADTSVYIRGNLIVAVYVDDLIIAGEIIGEVEDIKKAIAKKYKVKDLGELRDIVGMEWRRNQEKKKSTLHQSKYTEMILKKFNMWESKAASTPVIKLEKEEEISPKLSSNAEYMQAVGSLIYLATCTRPDIQLAVSLVSRTMKEPTEKNWIAVKRIFRYLNGTRNYGITYNGSDKVQVIGYADADWAGDHKDRKSTSGYVFTIANGAVSWASKKQNTVALSTVEAEYISGSLATQEAIWISKLLTEVGLKINVPKIFQDNQGCIGFSKNPVGHARTNVGRNSYEHES